MKKYDMTLTPVTPDHKYLLVIDVADAIGSCRGRGDAEYDRALGDISAAIFRLARYPGGGHRKAHTDCAMRHEIEQETGRWDAFHTAKKENER